MNTIHRISVALFLLLSSMFFSSGVQAELNCPVENQIRTQFNNGAAWQMCWDSRVRENIVLSDVHYQPAGKEPFSVFSTLRLSQLHVTYDDSNVTYNDVTQFGLGAGYISTLTEEDCPGGRLVEIGGRAGLCELISTGHDSYSTATETRKSQSLSVFSVSQVGSYAYLVTWKFFADGSVQPSVGAAGALQRTSDDHADFGRKLEGVSDKSWLSHTHNYYWQIDFDLGDEATDDIVSELNFQTDREGRRSRQRTEFDIEAARAINPDTMRSWAISDKEANDEAPGYLMEPTQFGHRLVAEPTDPYTEFDFFVTKQSDCERFISDNAKFNPDCDENILQFVNDEPIKGEDVVLWHRISFHHVPRNEDRHVMHSHWDGFVMEARNLSTQTPGHSGVVSEATTLAMQSAHDASDHSHSHSGGGAGSKSKAFGCSITSPSENRKAIDLVLLIGVLLVTARSRRFKKANNLVTQSCREAE